MQNDNHWLIFYRMLSSGNAYGRSWKQASDMLAEYWMWICSMQGMQIFRAYMNEHLICTFKDVTIWNDVIIWLLLTLFKINSNCDMQFSFFSILDGLVLLAFFLYIREACPMMLILYCLFNLATNQRHARFLVCDNCRSKSIFKLLKKWFKSTGDF